MLKVDITMTAVLRPKLLRGTLDSIVKNVVDNPKRFRLIINIDPIGEKVKPMAIVKIAKEYFNDVIYNIAKTPSFPAAVKWVWSQATAPFVLHWEDDVNILRKINIGDMMRILNEVPNLSSLRLYRGHTPKKVKSFKTFSCRWTYNKRGYYIANDWRKQFGLNPILIKRAFVSEAIERMIDTVNPEKQFRASQKYMAPLIKKWKYGLYAKPGEYRLIDGRKGIGWKKKHGLSKPVGRTFLKWEKK